MSDPLHQTAIVRSVADVRLLKQEIRGLIKEADAVLQRNFQTYREVGLRLLKLRESVGTGDWRQTLDDVGVSKSSAFRYMRLAQDSLICPTWDKLPRVIRDLDRKESGGGVKGKKSKVRTKFAWRDFDKEFGPVARVPERIVERYESEKGSEEYTRAVKLLDEFTSLMRAWRERLDK